MEFQLDQAIDILSRTPATLNSLLRGVPDEWTMGNEGSDTWSAYDVLGHLIHGEETDWIPRARIILEDGESRTFEPFDRFTQFEKSKGKSAGELLDEFETLKGWAYVTDGSRGSFGASPSIIVPEVLVHAVVEGGRELAEVIDETAGEHDVRSRQGAWGVLSRDLLTRAMSFEVALVAAFAPFYNTELYR